LTRENNGRGTETKKPYEKQNGSEQQKGIRDPIIASGSGIREAGLSVPKTAMSTVRYSISWNPDSAAERDVAAAELSWPN
jgi:hypothetical protein